MDTACNEKKLLYFPLTLFNSNDLNINDVGQVGILDESFDSKKILIPIVQCNDFNGKEMGEAKTCSDFSAGYCTHDLNMNDVGQVGILDE